MRDRTHPSPGSGTALLAIWLGGLSLLVTPLARSQIVFDSDRAQLTVEGFANVTLPNATGRIDSGLRVLGRAPLAQGSTLGIRLSVEEVDRNTRLTEASVLLFDSYGRVEIGERMGLPDVLTGYAPNNFQFTSAEFGPASGPSLDPGGGLQTASLHDALSERIAPLAGLGTTATLFDDRSAKILYVSPKTHGWLIGASYARDADDASVKRLFQAGITHESYRQQDTLRWGATYAHGGSAFASGRNLNSVGIGASLTLHEVWMIGLAASYDGTSRLPDASAGAFASPAWGATASVNFNSGPWTIGGYCQYATSEGRPAVAADDRLVAMEIGASYRFTTKVRWYAAWYRFDFDDDTHDASSVGNVFLLGARATL